MKKKYKLLFLFIFILISLMSVMRVKAAVGLCNIGFGEENSKGYGYYTIEDWTSYNSSGIRDISDVRSGKKCSIWGWCDNVQEQIYVYGYTDSKITNYEIYFVDDEGNDLCKISPKVGGAGITGNYESIRFDFHLLHGHVSKIRASVDYEDKDGEPVESSKEFSVKKRVGDTGSVKNPTATTTKSTTKALTAVEGYYMCNTTTIISASNTQECVRKKKGDSLTNCEKKPFKNLLECERELATTTITTTTAARNTTAETTGTIGIGEQAGLVQGTSPAGGYDPSNGNVQCTEISELINKYWKYIMIIAPVGLILLITVDFVKAITSSNDDQLKKSANSALKRTIATVVLLMLPVLLSAVLDWFDIPLCL